MTSAWMIRAGREGEREEQALHEGLAIAGWHELADITACTTRDELRAKVRETYPDASKAVVANWTGQLWRFREVIAEDDFVVMPLKNRRKIAIGSVIGPYEFRHDADPGMRHVRPVKWIRDSVPRNAVRQDLLDSMGSLLTVCGLTRFGAARRIAQLAEDGTDPGPEPNEMISLDVDTPYEFLADAAGRAPGQPLKISIRDMLAHWGAARRTSGVVARVEADLSEKGLTTRPAFTEGWIDSPVEIVRVGAEPGPAGEGRNEVVADDTEDISEMPAMALRVGDLKPATDGVTVVRPDEPLVAALTKMLAMNYSQLAVIDDAGNLIGAVSWESIGKARMANVHAGLAEATCNARVVEHDEDLLNQIGEIYTKGYVFVRGPDRKIAGIVTAADLTVQFGDLARPFVLVEEVEQRLRRRADEVIPLEEIRRKARARADRVNSAADLTLADYEHLLGPEENWQRLGWPLDQQFFLQQLRKVREIRNELVHFTPDPVEPARLAEVEGFVHMLRTVDPRA